MQPHLAFLVSNWLYCVIPRYVLCLDRVFGFKEIPKPYLHWTSQAKMDAMLPKFILVPYTTCLSNSYKLESIYKCEAYPHLLCTRTKHDHNNC